ncbi:AAA family ATPase [Bacillus subtilis]|uniref:AAA family ATPase n=1 Tax=Bacillus subtilis TaxID=1423 RepID=UPI00403F69CE
MKFHEQLTILYGLNGSGKTTVLDILFYILSGKINMLIKYKFSSLDLQFEKNKKLTRLTLHDKGEYIEGKLGDFEFELFKEPQLLESQDYKAMLNKNTLSDFRKEIVRLSETVYIPLNRRVRENISRGVPVPTKKRALSLSELKNNEEVENVYYAIPSENQKNIADSIKAANRHFELHKQRIVREENIINTALRNEMVENFSVPITTDLMHADDYDFSNLEEKMNVIFNDKKNFKTNIKELLTQYNETRCSYEKNKITLL